jgi:hypothetical protein
VRGLSSTMARMAIFRHAKSVAGGSSADTWRVLIEPYCGVIPASLRILP